MSVRDFVLSLFVVSSLSFLTGPLYAAEETPEAEAAPEEKKLTEKEYSELCDRFFKEQAATGADESEDEPQEEEPEAEAEDGDETEAAEQEELPDGVDREKLAQRCANGTDETQAVSKTELKLEYADAGDGLFRAIYAFGWAFGDIVSLTVEPSLVVANLSSDTKVGIGDLVTKLLIVPYYKDEQRGLMPRGVAFRLDVTFPFGEASKGTGGDAYILSPRFMLGWTPTSYFSIYPVVKYFHSIATSDLATKQRTFSTEINFVFNLPLRFWVTYKPEFFYNFLTEENTLDHEFTVGKMLFKSYGLYIEYTRISLGRNSLDGTLPSQGFSNRVLVGNQFFF